MALITPSLSGNPITYQNATAGDGETGGDTAAQSYRLHFRNGGGAPITITIKAYGACSHGFLHDLTFTVTNGSDKVINPPTADRYLKPADGLIHIGYSAVTSVTVGAF